MKLEFSRQIFQKYLNIKFYENPSGGNRVVPCGRTDGQTDMTKLIVAFRSFAKQLKMYKDPRSELKAVLLLPYTGLSKKMDGIWNRYNLKSTGRIYTFGVLKCSEKFKVLDLP